jgi:hypothetical protein
LLFRFSHILLNHVNLPPAPGFPDTYGTRWISSVFCANWLPNDYHRVVMVVPIVVVPVVVVPMAVMMIIRLRESGCRKERDQS